MQQGWGIHPSLLFGAAVWACGRQGWCRSGVLPPPPAPRSPGLDALSPPDLGAGTGDAAPALQALSLLLAASLPVLSLHEPFPALHLIPAVTTNKDPESQQVLTQHRQNQSRHPGPGRSHPLPRPCCSPLDTPVTDPQGKAPNPMPSPARVGHRPHQPMFPVLSRPPFCSLDALGSGCPGRLPPEPTRRAEHVRAIFSTSYNFPSFPLPNTLIRRTLSRPIEIQKCILSLRVQPRFLGGDCGHCQARRGRTHTHTCTHAYMHAWSTWATDFPHHTCRELGRPRVYSCPSWRLAQATIRRLCLQ